MLHCLLVWQVGHDAGREWGTLWHSLHVASCPRASLSQDYKPIHGWVSICLPHDPVEGGMCDTACNVTVKRFPWVVFSRNLSCLFSRRESVTKITPTRKAFWERGLCLPCSFQGKLFGRREEVVKSLFTKLETKIPSVYINKRENGLVVWAHGCN